jgi:predicted membrane-bound dolichyl-phosphate-mannose-protein mannosyltransferase
MQALGRLLSDRRAPLVALAAILALSLAARVVQIDEPCQSPCATPGEHTLIFDEAFYVNAARVIAGIHPPTSAAYAHAPLHDDPNAEHPQLAKLVIAGGIELFGDNAWGWRVGSVLFGLIALGALYALVRGAGGSPWLGAGAVAVMALDNLTLVHGRIATLDIYAVALMLVAGALYVRRRPWLAGFALGVGACMKVVALYLLVALALYEAVLMLQAGAGDRRLVQLRPLLACVLASSVAFFGLLWLLDLLVPAFDPGPGKLYAGSPVTHFSHMITYAASLKTTSHARGIASSPWQWLIDQKPIDYARVAVNELSGGRIVASHATIDFRGEMNPFIIFVALPALAVGGVSAWRSRDRVAVLGASWAVGTYVPFLVQGEIAHRISYIFYMLVVMPGVYLLAARLFSPRNVPRIATVVWGALLVYGFVRLYPLRTLLG